MSTPLISCGIVILNGQHEVLLAHVTHAPQWDIPKGCTDLGESVRAAALREAREESGLDFSHAPLLELGRFAYLPHKSLHLFAVKLPTAAVDPARCRCSSLFTDRHGRQFPEVDAFRWVPFDQVSRHCTERMARILLEDVGLGTLHGKLDVYPGEVQPPPRQPDDLSGSDRHPIDHRRI